MDVLIVYQSLAAVLCVGLIFASGFYAGSQRSSRKLQAQSAQDRQEMLTIERSLKQFWDFEREKLQEEKKELQRRIDFLEERLEQYRRKAAGIGMMGLRKNRLTDMLISLLTENEILEEKLFMQNLKLKEERDEFLKNEMRHISYKRVLLSELINQAEVRKELERALNDKGTWRRLKFNRDLTPLISEQEKQEGADEDEEEIRWGAVEDRIPRDQKLNKDMDWGTRDRED